MASALARSPTIHTVTVGLGGFMYNPRTTFANPGDIVSFEFFPTNHSVIRAEHVAAPLCPREGCNPCVPYEIYHPGSQDGFHTPNILTTNETVTWNFTVRDRDPVFFYCNAIGSCNTNGMIGAVNPNEMMTAEKQYQAAMIASYQLGPGQTPPALNVSTNGTSIPDPLLVSTDDLPYDVSRFGNGTIAAIVVCVVLALAIVVGLLWILKRRAGRIKRIAPSIEYATRPRYEMMALDLRRV